MDLKFFVRWFQDLKAEGVLREELFDVLEFESDQYPDRKLMEEARDMVYGKATGGAE